MDAAQVGRLKDAGEGALAAATLLGLARKLLWGRFRKEQAVPDLQRAFDAHKLDTTTRLERVEQKVDAMGGDLAEMRESGARVDERTEMMLRMIGTKPR